MADSPESVIIGAEPGEVIDPKAAGLFELSAPSADGAYLNDIWRLRAFLIALPSEEIRTRHQDTFLGNLWHLANPLLSAAVYYIIFGVLLTTGGAIPNYLGYLTIGVFAFNLTARTVTTGTRSVSGKAGLIRSMRFPRAMLPISDVMSHSMTFIAELTALAAVVLLTGERPSLRWLALPIILGIHSLLNLGLVFYVARLNEAFRDIESIVPFIFRLLIYFSGAMFPVVTYAKKYPQWVQTAARFNPLGAILDMYRWAFMGRPMDMTATAVMLLITAGLVVGGFRYFRAAEMLYGRS